MATTATRTRSDRPTSMLPLKCRFGCDEVVGIFYMPAGCVCYHDPVQALCGQHAISAQSTGPITCILPLIVGLWPSWLPPVTDLFNCESKIEGS